MCVFIKNCLICYVLIFIRFYYCQKAKWFYKNLFALFFKILNFLIIFFVVVYLFRHSKLYKIPWLRHLVFPTSQKPRNSLVLEVFLFLAAFYEPSRSQGDLAKCFRLAWDARKEPYVSKQELLNAFEDYMKVRDETQLWNTLEVLRFRFLRRVYDFKALLPDCQPLVPQPRSLQHLCRCTVREVLNNNLELPHGVGKLPIPNKMKSYILLK